MTCQVTVFAKTEASGSRVRAESCPHSDKEEF